MKAALRLALLCLAALLLTAPAPAAGAFGIAEAEVDLLEEGSPATLQAGTHRFEMETAFTVNTAVDGEGQEVPDGAIEDLTVELPAGLVADLKTIDRCTAAQFITIEEEFTACPDASALGIQAVKFSFKPIPGGVDEFKHSALFNLVPPPGTVAKLGFAVLGVPVTLEVTLNPEPPHNGIVRAKNISNVALFYSSLTTVWGTPFDSSHDSLRGKCLDAGAVSPRREPPSTGEECEVSGGEGRPFLTAPRSCDGPLATGFTAVAWDGAGSDSEIALTPPGIIECAKLGLATEVFSVKPTSQRASSPSGLDVDLQISDEGLVNPDGTASYSDIKKAVVTLPEGITANPSQAEGLEVCSEDDLADETAGSQFGDGCPAASKIGSVEVESPLLEEEIFKGSLFIAEPHENRFGSLLALYMVIKHRELGVVLRLAGEVEPDPETGQLITTFGGPGNELPQLPFSDFRLHFREGGRSPLITPDRCATYTTTAVFTPWANPEAPHTTTSSFRISGGPGGSPCPPPGRPPFEPGLSAGSLSAAAGQHSPFHLRLTRRDGDQDLVRFDATLPRGLVAKLAGVAQCPQAAIEAAKHRDGKDELARPSCPLSSQIGTAIGGAGTGSQLTYVPGKVYLAGPLGGAPLSVVAIVPAVAGPFDVGTVVTQQALRVHPRSAEVTVDGALSDPIPHILAGIPLKVRDIRAHIDRPGFTLNPTSCDPAATLAGIWGGGSDPFSLADDAPVPRLSPFQASGCAALPFAPRLGLKLRGGTRRGAFPALRAVFRPRPGHANSSRLALRFPRSAFIEQGHIRTICTRVAYAANACPKGAIYGRVTAHTPLLAQPLRGPVYLRSSNNELPDLVFDLHGRLDFEAVVRIDSIRGGLRAIVAGIPDAPITKVVVDMQGGQKGLIVNSRNLCAKQRRNRASVRLAAHSAKRRAMRPVVRATACKKRGARRSGQRRG